MLFVKILDPAQKAAVKTALANMGHEVVEFGESEAAKLWAELKAKEPALLADITKGVADYKDKAMSGGDKAVAVATDALATATDAVKAIPGIKDLLVHGATEVFADTESEVVKLGGELIAAL